VSRRHRKHRRHDVPVEPAALETEASAFLVEQATWQDEQDMAERQRWRNRYGRMRPPSLGDRFIWPGDAPDAPRWTLRPHMG
jgi:hypothetical protein